MGTTPSNVLKRCATCGARTSIPPNEPDCRECRRKARVELDRASRKMDADLAEVKVTLLAYATAKHGRFPQPHDPSGHNNHQSIIYQLRGLNYKGVQAMRAKRAAPPPVDDGSFVHWLLSGDCSSLLGASIAAFGFEGHRPQGRQA